MAHFRRALTLALLLAASGPGLADEPGRTPTPPRKLAEAHNAFGLALLKAAHRKGTNVLASPASLGQAFQLALRAADGETKAEMIKAMGLGSLDWTTANWVLLHALARRKGNSLSVANAIWGRTGRVTFDVAYQADARRLFDADTRLRDFASPDAVRTINEWVSERTAGKVPALLDAIEPDCVAMVTNAAYFKGAWSAKLDPANTYDAEFTGEDGAKTQVRMMCTKRKLAHGLVGTTAVVRLGFAGDADVGLWIAQPETGKSVDDVLGSLAPDSLATWRAALVTSEVTLRLPRFRLAHKAQLNDAAKAVGIRRAFDGSHAEFPAIKGAGSADNVCIGSVMHEAVLEVDEDGAEVDATSLAIVTLSTGQALCFDRPFVVAIADDYTGAILLVGAVHVPVPR